MTLQNDLILRAARSEAVPRTPVWMMRQAGRYLPEYRALRSEDEFFTVCRTPELAAEVTLQPIERFPLDAAIIFSDILVVPQALGMDVQMVKGKGPVFTDPLESPDDLARLVEPDVESSLGYVADAIRLTVDRLTGRVPLIGFCGAPWTLAAYMIEGSGSKSFSRARSWLYRHPDELVGLLDQLADVSIEYLDMQIRAGANLLQVFDSWAGMLGPREFERFALPTLQRIRREIGQRHPDVPVVVFAKGAHYALKDLAEAGYNVVSLDWTMDPRQARKDVGPNVALQGNLDPALLYAEPEVIRARVRDMLTAFGPVGHIANLGHGMHPDHNPDHAGAFIDAVHEVSEELIAAAVA